MVRWTNEHDTRWAVLKRGEKWKKLVYLKSLCVVATVKAGCDIKPPMGSVTSRQASKMFGLVQGCCLFFTRQCHQHFLSSLNLNVWHHDDNWSGYDKT